MKISRIWIWDKQIDFAFYDGNEYGVILASESLIEHIIIDSYDMKHYIELSDLDLYEN